MRPLLFLVSKSLINGVRRTLTSGKRLFAFVFLVGYYLWIATRSYGRRVPIGTNLPTINLPVIGVLNALVFAGFMLLSVVLLGQLSSYNRTMRQADIDVLFATPVSPKLVMILRITRDYFATLLLPCIFAIFSWGPLSSSGVFKSAKGLAHVGQVIQAAVYAWLLLAIGWTVLGYSTTLLVNRSDLASDRNRRVLSIGTWAIVLGTLSFIFFRLIQNDSLPAVERIADSPILRVPYFLAHFATVFALGPLTGVWNLVWSGLALIAVSVIGFNFALSQVGWMYDQAAVRGFETTESLRLRRTGDMTAILAFQARQGKVKAGRQTWLHRLRVPPSLAMIWREAVVQRRSIRLPTIALIVIGFTYSILPALLVRFSHSGIKLRMAGMMFLAGQAAAIFMVVLGSATSGYVELLRRIDLLKPLPFSPSRLMVVEVLAKTFLPVTLSALFTVVATAIAPELWQFAISTVMYGPSLAILLSSTTLVVTLLFPDVDDPTQRGFRGLMQLLALAIAVAPGLGVFITVAYFTKSPIPGAVIGSLMNLGVTAALTALAGYQYLSYNPTE